MKELLSSTDRITYNLICEHQAKDLGRKSYKALKGERFEYYAWRFHIELLDEIHNLSINQRLFLKEDMRKDIFNKALRISVTRELDKIITKRA